MLNAEILNICLALLGLLSLCLTTSSLSDTARGRRAIAEFHRALDIAGESCLHLLKALDATTTFLLSCLRNLVAAHWFPVVSMFCLRFLAGVPAAVRLYNFCIPPLWLSISTRAWIPMLAILSKIGIFLCSRIEPETSSWLEFMPVVFFTASIIGSVRERFRTAGSSPIAPVVAAESNCLIDITNPQLQEIQEELACCVCKDFMTRPYTISPCGHSGCLECLQNTFCAGRNGAEESTRPNVIHMAKSCPECRERVYTRPIPSFALQKVIKVLDPQKPSLVRENVDEWSRIFR
ncbi:hypothetical protein B0H17DRAFT_1044990 [Mycena rosella]|uniref:RING-type domain-containing protein n=1 Tax=Mycena rosella TaxID=1033263 RepID=A0AAD7GPT3_MYCRO|nr:hypothetical protein B0H17DRAFT_1044990 [Mycena rosella]